MEWDIREDRGVDKELEIKVDQVDVELKEGARESGESKRRGWWDEECEKKGKRRGEN